MENVFYFGLGSDEELITLGLEYACEVMTMFLNIKRAYPEVMKIIKNDGREDWRYYSKYFLLLPAMYKGYTTDLDKTKCAIDDFIAGYKKCLTLHK